MYGVPDSVVSAYMYIEFIVDVIWPENSIIEQTPQAFLRIGRNANAIHHLNKTTK